MDFERLLTYVGFGYIVGISLLGPAVLSTVLRDLHERGKIGRVARDSLLLTQYTLSLLSLVVVIGTLFRSDKANAMPAFYGYITVLVFIVASAAVLASGAYLNTKLGKPWHGMN